MFSDRRCREALVTFLLYNNTHHPAFAVVDDFLHGILKLCLAFFADGGNLATDAVLYELFDGFAEDIGLRCFAALAALANVLDEIVCCCSVPTIGGRSLSRYWLLSCVWTDSWSGFYAELISLTDNRRSFDLDLGKFGHNYSVAGGTDGFRVHP